MNMSNLKKNIQSMNAVPVGVVAMNQAVLNKYVVREVAFTVGSVRPMAKGKRLAADQFQRRRCMMYFLSDF